MTMNAVECEPREDSGPAEVDLCSSLRLRVVRNLLLGEAGSIDRRIEASVIDIDTGRDYVAFHARVRRGRRREELVAELGLAETRQPRIGLAAEVDGDVIGFLPEPPTAVTSGVVGVGPAAPPDRLVESFELASRAMEAGQAFGLTGVYAFGDLGLLPTIVADTDVGETVWRRYVQPLCDVESGPETVTALRTYFACGMHVDRAASELTLHPNTLRNRIARFEELIGADLRDATVAMQVWWALQVHDSGGRPRGWGERYGPLRLVTREERPPAGKHRPPVPLADRVGPARHRAPSRRHRRDEMTERGASPGARPLLRVVFRDQDSLRERISSAIRHQMPSGQLAANDGFVDDLDAVVYFMQRVTDTATGRETDVADRLRAVGASHARLGRPLGDLLVAHQIRRQVIVDFVREAGALAGSSAAEVLETVEFLLKACNTVWAEVAAGYHGAGPLRHVVDRERAEFVRGLLWGTLAAAERESVAAAHLIDLDREYFAVRARPAQGRAIGELARAHGLGYGRSYGGGLGAVVDGDLVGFVTAPPQGLMPGVSGLGPARPLRLLHESFRMASRALHVAARRSMTGVCEFDRLGLLPAILADKATGDMLCQRYFTPLGDTEFATEIIDTVRAYLLQGMHVPRTADALCVHPNTVRYRIAKFEELTGVAFRSDRTVAFEVLWALEHRATPGREEKSWPQTVRHPPAATRRINGATVDPGRFMTAAPAPRHGSTRRPRRRA